MKFLGTPTPFTTTKQKQVGNFLHIATKMTNKKTSMIKAPHCPTSCIVTKGKPKMSKKLKPPYPLCYYKKPNIKTIKTNKQV